MGTATAKQIAYAIAIAKELRIPAPKDDFDTCHDFISQNVERYKSIKENKSLVEELRFCYGKYFDDIGEKSALWIQENLHKVAGVYAFIGSKNKVLYIGKSMDLATRIPTSYCERAKQSKIKKVMYFKTPSQADVGPLEMILIAENAPLLNRDGKTKDKPIMFKSGIDILRDFSEIPLKKK